MIHMVQQYVVIKDNFWQILLECQNYLEVLYSEASSRFEVRRVILMKIQVFWIIMPYQLFESSRLLYLIRHVPEHVYIIHRFWHQLH